MVYWRNSARFLHYFFSADITPLQKFLNFSDTKHNMKSAQWVDNLITIIYFPFTSPPFSYLVFSYFPKTAQGEIIPMKSRDIYFFFPLTQHKNLFLKWSVTHLLYCTNYVLLLMQIFCRNPTRAIVPENGLTLFNRIINQGHLQKLFLQFSLS